MEAENSFGKPLRGLEITQNDDDLNYNVFDVENRAFSPKMYLYPIPQSELNINSKWVQNPLW